MLGSAIITSILNDGTSVNIMNNDIEVPLKYIIGRNVTIKRVIIRFYGNYLKISDENEILIQNFDIYS